MSEFIMKRVDQSIEEYQLGTLPASDAEWPDASFLEELPEESGTQLGGLLKRYEAGAFPDLTDFNPEFGADLSECANMDSGVWALGNDGSGNYFVLYPDGAVDSWCHEEGGFMEQHDFTSLDSMTECLVYTTAVKQETLSWEDIHERFEEMSENSGGWEFFMENCEEFVEDL